LVSKGVPWHVIEEMDDVEEIAWYVAMGEIEGSEFDWNSMSWRKKED